MAIAFVGAGSGVERLTAGTVAVSKATCTAGNLIVIHTFFNGDTGDGGATNFSNISGLDGVLNDTTSVINAVNRQVMLGRVTADGTCGCDLLIGASGDDGVARIYEFSGVSTSTTLANVVENGSGTNVEGGFSASTTVADAGVTTNGANRLALNFVCVRSTPAIGAFTGMTGGTWAEAVAEYIGTTIKIQLQTATMASAGVIDGGTISITSAYWITIGTALIPFVASGTQGPGRLLMLGVG